jgi:RNA polymerase sigma-70 factor, ECF subfamily
VLPSALTAPEPDPRAPVEGTGAAVRWLQPAPDAMLTPESAGPAAIVTAREGLRLALIASLQFLPPKQRAVLVLRDVLAFPATEVAGMLGTTTVSVKSALQRARARLKELAPAADQIAEPTESRARALLDAAVAYTRGQHGHYQPYGICVLTVSEPGIRRIHSFADPSLVTLFESWLS